jgi:LacI family transcriptional regulator
VVTSHDVAAAAGVSQATVSRTLSGVGGVSEKTRARVLKASEKLGYELNHAARAMRTQRSGTIGVVVDRVTNPFYPEVIESLSRILGENDLRMILWESQGAGERGAIQAIGQRMVDGLIFTTATESSMPLAIALAAGAPMVLVNRIVEGVLCDQIDTDNASISGRIAAYFAKAGHVRAGLIGGSDDASTARDRGQGFLAGAKKNGLLVPDELVIGGGFSHMGGYEALHRMFEQANPPTAIFCGNDLSAFGALDAARSLKIRVPEDLWVTGYDDINMASWKAFDLTTARQPIDAMVTVAVQLLLERIDNPKKQATHQRFSAEMMVRGSTANTPFN